MNRYSKLTPLLSIRCSLCKMLLAGGLLLSAASLLSAQNASHDGQSTEGTDFWVTFLRADSHDGDDKKITLSVSISAREACDVTLENIRSGYKEEVHLNANELKEVQLYYGTARVDKNPRQSDTKICYTYLSERIDSSAIHVTATANISLFASNHKDKSFDATNVLPTTALNDEYVIQTYPPSVHSDTPQGSHFAIVATEDNTVVDYTPTVDTEALNGFRSALAAWGIDKVFEMYPEYERFRNYTTDGSMATDTLQAGEVWYVWTGDRSGESADLSGTTVKARNGKKIAVFQGCPHTNIPDKIRDRDHIFSQAMPTTTWGTNFALTASLTRKRDIIRVLALHDDTEVRVNGNLIYTFDFSTNPKRTFEFELGEKNVTCSDKNHKGALPLAGREDIPFVEGTNCFVETSCPCAVHLFMCSNTYDSTPDGDPAMVWINPIEQVIDQITFATYMSTNTHYVNIVTTKDNVATMQLDGTDISADFAPVTGSNDRYWFARKNISYATHTLQGKEGFIAHVYGYGDKESYGYSAGGATKTLTSSITINGKEFTADSNNLICGIDEVNFGCSLNYNFEKIVWGFGDGTAPYTDNGPDSVSNVTHLYEKDGVYEAYALVYRTSTNLCEGQSAMDSIPIKVNIGRFTFSMGEPEIPCNNGVEAWIGRIPFNNESGTDLESDNTTIEFDANAIAAGFSNADLVLRDSHFEINIPDDATVGTEYGIHIVITSECGGTDTTLYFQLNYDADVLSQRADNVLGLLAEPFEGDELSGFQWYSIDAAGDTTAIDGQVSATLNWYDLPADQYNGNTYFLCFCKNRGTEKEVRTCTCDKGFTGDDGDLVFEIPDSITIVQQNMAHIGERIFVNAKLPSTLTWLTVDGTAYATEDIPAGGRTVEVPDREGFYILRVATLAEKKKNVQTRNFKFLVTK